MVLQGLRTHLGLQVRTRTKLRLVPMLFRMRPRSLLSYMEAKHHATLMMANALQSCA